MNGQAMDGELVNLRGTYSLGELCAICGIDSAVASEMTRHGLLVPLAEAKEPRFSEIDLLRSQKALRLRQDLDIDWPGLALVLDLLEEMQRLRDSLARSRAEAPRVVIDSDFSA